VADAAHPAGTVPGWPPYIARIGGDKERQIANQAQASGVGMFLEALALAEKQELCEPHLIDLACQLDRGW
jgi:hypothetical protein